MATKAGPGAGKSTSKTSAARKRAPSKPVIIDVEADKAAKAPEKSSSASASGGSPAAQTSAGLNEATARAAGLSASGPAPQSTAGGATESNSESTPASSMQVSDSPPDAAAGPRAFVLAAAGFIGALAALALMFLAQLLGFVSLPNGQLDEQRSALLAMEERVDARLASLESAETSQAEPAPAQVDLSPIEADLAQLRDEIALLNAQPVSDGAPVDFDALIADALMPLEERIGAIEAVVQFPTLPLDESSVGPSNGVAESDPALATDPEEISELRDLIETVSSDIATLRSTMGSVQVDLEVLANTETPDAEQFTGLDERLTQLSFDTAGRFEALSMRAAELGDTLVVMGDRLTAFEQAPIAVAPDQLARLGLALDGLTAARDNGTGLTDALAAAQMASAFDVELSGALAPLSSLAVDSGLNDAGLLGRYEGASVAMRAAVPGSMQESSGLLDALGERARQMVTIRAPGDASSDAPGTVSGQIDQLGNLVTSGEYEAALAAFDDLPDAVKAVGSDVRDGLDARLTFDNALTQARSGLLAALASSNQ